MLKVRRAPASRPATDATPTPIADRHRRRHELFRHARHRLVRDDDRAVPVPAALVPDRIIPGTLNVGHTLPTVVQAFIFTAVIPVDVAHAASR